MSQYHRTSELERIVRRERAEVGDVDLAPHEPSQCPQWLAEQLGFEPAPRSECPYVGCRLHLYTDVNPESGELRITRPALEPWELPDTCAIDVAMRGTHSYDQIAFHLGVVERQARQIGADAMRVYGPRLKAALDEAEADAPGCCDWLELGYRRGGMLATGKAPKIDARSDDPEECDRSIPEGYVPRALTVVEVMGTHREVSRLSDEHLMRQYRLPRMAERLYLMLIGDAALRRCGTEDLTRAYCERAGCSVKSDKVVTALADLERAKLVACDWEQCGKRIRRLHGVRLLSSLPSTSDPPDVGIDDDSDDASPAYLRASDDRESVDLE